MGNSASKTPVVKQAATIKKQATLDENFGREIMKNIKLNESLHNSNQKSVSTNLKRRMELDKQTEGTISWDEFPLIFKNEKIGRIDADKVAEIKKYFSLPIKK